jgi:type I restriction enzyme S subunit
MVAIVRVPVTDFSPERLDTGFYSKEFYAARAQILKCGLSLEPIGSVCEPWQFGAYALCNDIVWSNADEGIPFLKAESIESPLVNEPALSYVTKDTHSLLAKSALKAGDIIMSTSGTIGRLAVLPDAIPVANSNQDTIKFSLTGTTYDSHFVAAWLTSKYAQAFMSREAGGAVQQHIYLYNFKRLPLLKLDPASQKYIGDKVRQAERLRAWAKMVVTKLDAIFAEQYPPLSTYEQYRSKYFRMDAQSTFDVLTPESYPPEIGQYFRENKFLTLGEISTDIFTGSTQDDAEGESSVFQATSRSCSGLFLRKPFNQVVRPKNGKFLRKLDILLTCGAHDKKYIGKDVSIYHDDQENLPSSKVLVVRLKGHTLPAAYVHSYLKSDAGYIQWQSVVRGISAGIHPGDVARIRIPVPVGTKEWHENFLTADDNIVLAGKAIDVAFQLTNAAKSLVEALIEGQLTEADLIAAEQALQAGNDQLDRRILNRLKTDGIDGQGQPLLSDLDQLYSLLEQASHS